MSAGNGIVPISTALDNVQSNERSFNREQIDLIKNTIAIGATDDELKLFVATANRMGLDPFARQIFAVKRWNNELRREVMQCQVSIDGFRLVAERTGNYAPGDAPTFLEDAKGNIVSATAYVKKFSHGEWHVVAATAYWKEYAQTRKDGALTRMWQQMPHTMISKCAESLALRKAFPAELSGVYTPEEMDQSENDSPSKPRAVKATTIAELKANRKQEPATAVDFDAQAHAIAESTPDLTPIVPNGEVATGRAKSANGAQEREPGADAEEDGPPSTDALLALVDAIENVHHAKNWRKAHAADVAALSEADQAKVSLRFYERFPELKRKT